MTINAAPAARLASYTNTSSGLMLTTQRYRAPEPQTRLPMRNFEIAALRRDGSVFIGQDRAPAIPMFENAFSAFARGTLIQTPQGDIAVEDLQPGDMINTSAGKPGRLTWIGSSNFAPANPERRMPLIRIMADAFGQGRPSSFLTVGPTARILQTPHHLRAEFGEAQMLTPVQEFIDGVNVIEVVPPTPVQLFHLCLDRHAVIKAGGIEMETFHPGSTSARSPSDALRSRFLDMFPQMSHLADFGPLVHMRAPDGEISAQAG